MVSCGLTGCGDDKKSEAPASCDPANKPATAISCDCVNGAWEMCVYPQGDKCATSNCGGGTVCDPDTGDCVPSGNTCKCDDDTDCPGGNKANCTAADACDGKACKAAGTCSDVSGTCTCNNGGDIANDCAAVTDACDGKACKAAGTCSDNGGVCECSNGGDIANDCAVACICDDGSACPEGGIDACPKECKNTLPARATKCGCDDTTGLWIESTCEYPACVDDGNKTASTCDCEKGEWVDCDFCKNIDAESLLVGQVCEAETGNIIYDPAPALIVNTSRDQVSVKEGQRLQFSVKLNAEPSEDVAVVATANDPSIKIGDCAAAYYPTNITIAKNKWNADTHFCIRTDLNSIEADKEITVTLTASSDDPAFNSMASVDKNITIVDVDQPGIIVSCPQKVSVNDWRSIGSTYNRNNVGQFQADKRDFEAGITDSPECTVKLSGEPSAETVTVTISGAFDSAFNKPTAYINGESAGIKDFESATLTFTKANYDTEQTVKFNFPMPEINNRTLESVQIRKYTFSAKSEQANYKVDPVSAVMNVRPTFRYFHIGYQKREDMATTRYIRLPAGKYRLHAWGAPGGYLYDANMKVMAGEQMCYNSGGYGAYIRGDLTLTEPTNVYIFVGLNGESNNDGKTSNAFNGGGAGKGSINNGSASGGGGATDFCIGDGCNSFDDAHMPYRILVAGGGGGGTEVDKCYQVGETLPANYGKGGHATWEGAGKKGRHNNSETNESSNSYTFGGAGAVTEESIYYTNLFGKGADVPSLNYSPVGGAGAGWHGGSYQYIVDYLGGPGGSSYAWTGDNKDIKGKQDAKYALTNVMGRNGGTKYFPHPSYDEDLGYIFIANYLKDTSLYQYKEDSTGNNVGEAYIEILYEEMEEE